MAKRVLKLDFVDIVMGARAEVIKEAYDARLKIDDLLDARESAYKKIAEIEQHVEEIVGVEGDFVFPAPPLPVAGIPRPMDSTRPKKVVRNPVTTSNTNESNSNANEKLNDESVSSEVSASESSIDDNSDIQEVADLVENKECSVMAEVSENSFDELVEEDEIQLTDNNDDNSDDNAKNNEGQTT